MTPSEYADKLLEEAKEINFQYQVLVDDIKWLSQQMDEINASLVTATGDEQYEALEKKFQIVRSKFKINLEAQAKVKKAVAEFDQRFAGFKGGMGVT